MKFVKFWFYYSYYIFVYIYSIWGDFGRVGGMEWPKINPWVGTPIIISRSAAYSFIICDALTLSTYLRNWKVCVDFLCLDFGVQVGGSRNSKIVFAAVDGVFLLKIAGHFCGKPSPADHICEDRLFDRESPWKWHACCRRLRLSGRPDLIWMKSLICLRMRTRCLRGERAATARRLSTRDNYRKTPNFSPNSA